MLVWTRRWRLCLHLNVGGGALKLEVEMIDAGLTDLGGVWAARGRPAHEET